MLVEALALVSSNQKKYGRAQKLVKTSELPKKLGEWHYGSLLLLNFLTKVKFKLSYYIAYPWKVISSLGSFINVEEV